MPSGHHGQSDWAGQPRVPSGTGHRPDPPGPVIGLCEGTDALPDHQALPPGGGSQGGCPPKAGGGWGGGGGKRRAECSL